MENRTMGDATLSQAIETPTEMLRRNLAYLEQTGAGNNTSCSILRTALAEIERQASILEAYRHVGKGEELNWCSGLAELVEKLRNRARLTREVGCENLPKEFEEAASMIERLQAFIVGRGDAEEMLASQMPTCDFCGKPSVARKPLHVHLRGERMTVFVYGCEEHRTDADTQSRAVSITQGNKPKP